MANIKRIENKTNISYQITVSSGRDSKGKQIRHYKTYTPAPSMTERQAEKELNRIAVEFEKEIEQGYIVDNKQTFEKYASYVIDLKERTGIKHRTICRYKELLERINPAIGHIKLAELRPQHLNKLYEQLGQEYIRKDNIKALSMVNFTELMKTKKLTRDKLSKLASLSPSTITCVTRGEKVSLLSAEKIASALNMEKSKLFSIEYNESKLSNKTIVEHHRLISTILTQAEKEMLIPFNPASKATPPKIEKHDANYFQIEEVEQIRDALEEEPIKWKTATHLLLLSGARRGEIMGLKWNKIDWKKNQIKIDNNLLYASDIEIYEDSTKTSSSNRTIKLPTETMELLRQYKIWYMQLAKANGDRWVNSNFLFVQENGSPMHPDSLTDWLSKFSKRHKLIHIKPHAFRHTMASILYFNGVDSISISSRLGHAKVSTTTDIYSHMIKEADEQASECIADVILRPKKITG